MDDINEEWRSHKPSCSYFGNPWSCNCGWWNAEARLRKYDRWIMNQSNEWISMTEMHRKLNDLFQIIKSQYQSGSLSLEEYQKALEIMSS